MSTADCSDPTIDSEPRGMAWFGMIQPFVLSTESPLPPNARLVYCAMTLYAGKQRGGVRPSIKTLMGHTGLSRRAVIYALKQIEGSRLAVAQPRADEQGGSLPTLYMLCDTDQARSRFTCGEGGAPDAPPEAHLVPDAEFTPAGGSRGGAHGALPPVQEVHPGGAGGAPNQYQAPGPVQQDQEAPLPRYARSLHFQPPGAPLGREGATGERVEEPELATEPLTPTVPLDDDPDDLLDLPDMGVAPKPTRPRDRSRRDRASNRASRQGIDTFLADLAELDAAQAHLDPEPPTRASVPRSMSEAMQAGLRRPRPRGRPRRHLSPGPGAGVTSAGPVRGPA